MHSLFIYLFIYLSLYLSLTHFIMYICLSLTFLCILELTLTSPYLQAGAVTMKAGVGVKYFDVDDQIAVTAFEVMHA